MIKKNINPWSHPKHRYLAIALSLLLLVCVFSSAYSSSAAQARPASVSFYVAMGDSFSSGEGGLGYIPPSDSAANQCHRSGFAYSSFIETFNQGRDLKSIACSGAKAENILSKGQYGEAPQIQQLNNIEQSPNQVVKNVTITIGGNDLGFKSILLGCIYPSDTNTCQLKINNQIGHLEAVLGDLKRVYLAIHSKAPYAKITVLGYPALFDPHPSTNYSCAFERVNALKIREAVKTVDEQISSQVMTLSRTGLPVVAGQSLNIEFVNEFTVLDGHNLCKPDPKKDAWINGFTVKLAGVAESYHPTARGYMMMAHRVDSLEAHYSGGNSEGDGNDGSGSGNGNKNNNNNNDNNTTTPPPGSAPNTFVSTGPTPTTNDYRTLNLSSSPDGASFECRYDSGAWTSCSDPKTYTLVAVGVHTVAVRATLAGLTDQSPASTTWTRVAPTAAITSGPDPYTMLHHASFTFSSNEATDNIFECKLDGAAWQSPCPNPRTYTQLTVGSHTLLVHAKVLGAESANVSRSWTVKLPDVVITTFARDNNAHTGTLYFYSNDPEATFQCQFDNQNWAACTNGRHYTQISCGAHTVRVRAVDLGAMSTPAEWPFTQTC